MSTISVDDLKKNLEVNFQIVCFVDLASVYSNHSAIFNLFAEKFQDEYAPNQRLVFYSSRELDQNFLNHIQRAAASVNISNYFILICSPYNLSNKLKLANHKFGNDDVCINYLQVNLHETKLLTDAGFHIYETHCPLPFGMTTIKRTGDVSPCCKYQEKLGNIKHNSLKDVFGGIVAQKLRNDLKNGIKPPECNVCWQHEKTGTTSLRQHSLHKYGKISDKSWIKNPTIKDITFSPSFRCNFKCRICNSRTSSEWFKEDAKFASIDKNIKLIHQQSNNDIVLEIFKNIHDVEHLHILGGEPLLWDYLLNFLNFIIDAGRAEYITIEFNSNGSVFPSKVMNKLLKFKKVEILLSIDDIGERFELQRGGSWKKVYNNILKFKALQCSNFCVKIICTVNIQNLIYLEDLVDFANNHELAIVWWYLENPSFFCIDNITKKTQKYVYEKFSNSKTSELRSIAERISKANIVDGKEFCNFIKTIDARRNEKFSESHSKIAQLMGLNDE